MQQLRRLRGGGTSRHTIAARCSLDPVNTDGPSKRGQDGPGLYCQIAVHGTFSLRSPVRPNPIGTSIVKLEAVEGSTLLVRGLDCLDGTPLIDLKPDRTPFKPIAPPQRGDFEAGDSGPHNCEKA